jgi:hypothetical protein
VALGAMELRRRSGKALLRYKLMRVDEEIHS